MIIVPEVNIWTPKHDWPEWMKRKWEHIQRSVSAFPHGIISAAAGGTVVTISGGNLGFVTDFDFGGTFDSRLGLRVNTDGTIDKYSGIASGAGYSYAQINSTTDWIIPNSAASSAYQVRLDVTFTPPNFSSAATGSWLALTASRQWILRRTTGGSNSLNWTLRIRLNTGAEIDNGVYTGSINNESF